VHKKNAKTCPPPAENPKEASVGTVAGAETSLTPLAGATPVPADLLTLLNKGCKQVSTGMFATDDGEADTVPVCQLPGAFWWKADMDIDCDGVKNAAVCGNDPSNQTQTSFTTSTGKFFDAVTVPYYVIPNATDTFNGGPQTRFNYQKNNIKPGAVGAIVYNNRVMYAVFADEGPANIIGEASVAAARGLGINADPANGGTDGPVYYVVFTGDAAVPKPMESPTAAAALGQQLVGALLKAGGGGGAAAPAGKVSPVGK
jgi:hypothetical protein